MDDRVGGGYEFRYRWEEEGISSVVRDKILKLVPERTLSYTWKAERSDRTEQALNPEHRSTVVTWTLEQLPHGKTLVTLVRSGVAKEFWQGSETGRSHFIGRLADYCKGTALGQT